MKTLKMNEMKEDEEQPVKVGIQKSKTTKGKKGEFRQEWVQIKQFVDDVLSHMHVPSEAEEELCFKMIANRLEV